MSGPIISVLTKRLRDLEKERLRIDREIEAVNRSIMKHRALQMCRKIGLRLMDKTVKKAEYWGTIIIIIMENGPLKTCEIKSFIDNNMSSREYNTLRSHIFRMSMDGLIKQDNEKKWFICDMGKVE